MALEPRLECLSPLKHSLEGILGRQAWSDLKMCTSIPVWRRYLLRAIAALRVSIKATIEIHDMSWIEEVNEVLDHGTTLIKLAKDPETLLSAFSATLLELSLLQIGQLPNRALATDVTLNPKYWTLRRYRSVQYVQSAGQAEVEFWDKQERGLGVAKQRALHDEYLDSKFQGPFSVWCKEKERAA
jgi:hypothetical protein